MIEKFLEALDNGDEYEFISNWYNDISKFDFRTILLEYINATRYVDFHDKVVDEVRENLEDMTMNF